MQDSFKAFTRAVFHKWGWIVTGLIGGGVFILNSFGINPSFSKVIGACVLVICLFVACFLAYHELLSEKIRLASLVKKQNIITASRPLNPKKRLRFYDNMALYQVQERMEKQHYHCDINVIKSEILTGRTIGEIMSDNCTICGKPRNSEESWEL